MIKKYCRAYLLIAVVFIALSFAGEESLFLVFYPCLLCGIIPVSLIGYDERSKWMQYSGALPYAKEQIVSSKYLIGLFSQTAVIFLTAVTQGIKMCINNSFQIGDFVGIMITMLIISTVSSSICLPFIFKLGVEKGRLAYYIMIGFVCAGSVIAPNLLKGNLNAGIQTDISLIIISFISMGIYALSWYLSVVFFKKRELF